MSTNKWKWANVSLQDICSLKKVMSAYETVCGLNEQKLLVNINQRTKALYPIDFKGLKFNVNKMISDSVLYNCKLDFDTSNATTYKTYNRFINREPLIYPSQTSSPGFFNLTFQHPISDEWKCTILAHFLPEGGGGLDVIMNYYNDEFTGSFSLSNKGFSNAEVSVNYLQEVSKSLSVGAEVVSDVGATALSSRFTLAGKYFNEYNNATISGSIGTKGAQVCLHKMLSPKICIGSIADYLFEEKSFLGSLSGQWTEEKFILRVSIDTNKYIGMNLLRDIYVDDYFHANINWAAFTNFVNEIKFGIGFDFFIKN